MDLSGPGIDVKLKERKKDMNMQEKGWGPRDVESRV
jgi:hypothetical protein